MLHMRLSARSDYALRAVIELAAAGPGHVTADQLARAQAIPGKFLEAILTQLRRAGLVRSQRGPEGGFWLARPAGEISLADVIRAIDGPLLGVRGERPENVDYTGAAEPLQSVWIALRATERAQAHRGPEGLDVPVGYLTAAHECRLACRSRSDPRRPDGAGRCYLLRR